MIKRSLTVLLCTAATTVTVGLLSPAAAHADTPPRLYDTNGDGYTDAANVDADGDGYYETWAYATTPGCYRFDRFHLDMDRSGTTETTAYDTNCDGVADVFQLPGRAPAPAPAVRTSDPAVVNQLARNIATEQAFRDYGHLSLGPLHFPTP